jgi:enoyl-CoA hydratase/carnithine racemase
MIELEQVGPVWVVHLRSGENRFNDDFVDELGAAFDRVERAGLPTAVVTTGESRFYSNGLDLDWLGTSKDPAGFMDRVNRLLVRILTFPAVTVAAVNGHAFAAGAMLAAAHDFTVMREDRGFWCLPEVDLGLPLTPVMYAVVSARLPGAALHEALTTGQRYDAAAARAVGIVHEQAAESEVLSRAIELATGLAGKDPGVIRAHKQLMYAEAVRLSGS